MFPSIAISVKMPAFKYGLQYMYVIEKGDKIRVIYMFPTTAISVKILACK